MHQKEGSLRASELLTLILSGLLGMGTLLALWKRTEPLPEKRQPDDRPEPPRKRLLPWRR